MVSEPTGQTLMWCSPSKSCRRNAENNGNQFCSLHRPHESFLPGKQRRPFMILPTTGCPPRLLSIVKFFHEDMKTAFSMTPSCILGFQATQLVRTGLPSTRLILFILSLLYVGESQRISEANKTTNTTVPDSTTGWRFLPWKERRHQ